VLSVSPNLIRVRTPAAAAAGVTVGVGEAKPVNVAVQIHVNEPGQLSDSLTNGFTYALGGGILQPQVLSVSPSTGTNDGGTPITIIGDGFEQPVQVLFGHGGTAANFSGVEATVQSVTRNRIVATTPAARGFGQDNVNQQVDILVKNLNTGFSTVAPGYYRYGSQVLITAMGPGSGPYGGGTRVTIFGQGFESPVAVTLGGIGQFVIGTTGTEIIIQTSGVPVTTCPANGVIPASGVTVTNINTGATASAPNLTFSYLVPLPVITGVNPNGGNAGLSTGSTTTISGHNFGNSEQVLFGDPTNGNSAQVNSITHGVTDTINVTVPSAPPGFTFNTVQCDDNGDNIFGTKQVATPLSVTVRNLDGTGCFVTLSNAVTLAPPSTTCNEPPVVPPAPQCSDGLDNDGDGQTDFPADPQCASANDNSESS
jgi:hypothetical protein